MQGKKRGLSRLNSKATEGGRVLLENEVEGMVHSRQTSNGTTRKS